MKAATKRIIRYQENHLTPLLSTEHTLEIIRQNRRIQSDEELDLSLAGLLPFQTLKNINEAAALLADNIMEQRHICIIGDFDTDGATSTALAVSALRSFGVTHVNYLVPNRFKFGYGLTPEIVVEAKKISPDLIITVDNGIASLAGVAKAHELGIKVLITDHHLPGRELPHPAVIVNPNQPGDFFPSKNLAGVGVIFYMMMATRSELRQRNWFNTERPEPNLAQLLDLVALGTIADVVPLDRNNRILAQQGLQRIKAGQCRPGISALIGLSKRKQSQVVSSDLGFIVAPRLNAAGRLEDMSLGIECLLADNMERAQELAQRLELLNQERRAIEADMQQDAYAALQKLSLNSKNLPSALCMYQEHWHQGVTGIIAARLKDRFARPTIAFAKISDQELKGSARSIPGLHIRDLLDQIATENPNLLNRFGGHAMAAGVSLDEKNFETFSAIFDQKVANLFSQEQFANVLYSDGELSANALTIDTAFAVKKLGPFGQGFSEPLFDNIFELADQRLVGGRHLKLSLKLSGGDTYFDAIAFNVEPNEWPNRQARKAHIGYQLDINEFNNRQRLQLIVHYLQDC